MYQSLVAEWRQSTGRDRVFPVHWEEAGTKPAWRARYSRGLDPGLGETCWQEEQCRVDSSKPLCFACGAAGATERPGPQEQKKGEECRQ